MPATLSSFWNDEVSRLSTLLTKANLQVTTASTAENAASADLIAAGKKQDSAKAAVEAARKALAGIPMPADGDPLLINMRDALIALASANAEQVDKDTVLRQARVARVNAANLVSSLTASLANANAEAKTEKAAADQRLIWSNAAKAAPLKDLPTLATTALTTYEAGAKTKVEGDFPSNGDPDKDFLTRVRARRALAITALDKTGNVFTDALSNSKTWEESSTRASAKIAALRRDFDSKVSALKAFFDAPARVKQAQEQLKTLANRPASPLTAAQKKVLISSDTVLTSLREDTLKQLKTRDEAQATLFTAQEVYAKTLLTTLLANPSKTEAELVVSNATLKSKKKDVTDALKAINDVNIDATFITNLPTLKAWFAAVPDVLWEQLETLDTASVDLNAVKAIVPLTLISDIDAAEALLVAQLVAARDEQLTVAIRADSLAQDDKLLSIAAEVSPRRQQVAGRFVDAV